MIDGHTREILFAIANATSGDAVVHSRADGVSTATDLPNRNAFFTYKSVVNTTVVVSDVATALEKGPPDPFRDLSRLPTVKRLAVAVLLGDPCGRELVDELIANEVIDVNGEFAAKVRRDERNRVFDFFRRAETAARQDGDTQNEVLLHTLRMFVEQWLRNGDKQP